MQNDSDLRARADRETPSSPSRLKPATGPAARGGRPRRNLEREVLQIALREQQRIGRDLHDGLGQDLTSIALLLRAVATRLRVEGSGASADIEQLIALVNETIENTRELARGLSPVSTRHGGLVAALRKLVAQTEKRYGITVSLETRTPEPPPLDETAATHLYRIAQEALTNVVRHSRASRARVRLVASGERLVLSVEDNGCGLEGAPRGVGMGLTIMRFRARLLGARLRVGAAASGGSYVRCTLSRVVTVLRSKRAVRVTALPNARPKRAS